MYTSYYKYERKAGIFLNIAWQIGENCQIFSSPGKNQNKRPPAMTADGLLPLLDYSSRLGQKLPLISRVLTSVFRISEGAYTEIDE